MVALDLLFDNLHLCITDGCYPSFFYITYLTSFNIVIDNLCGTIFKKITYLVVIKITGSNLSQLSLKISEFLFPSTSTRA
jgi:hypothetical protein